MHRQGAGHEDWDERSERHEGDALPLFRPRFLVPIAGILLLIGGCPAAMVSALCLRALTMAPRPAAAPPATAQTQPTPPRDQKRVYTREAFKQLVVGKQSHEFLGYLGWPHGGFNGERNGDGTIWIYRRVTIDPVTGELDREAELLFLTGVCIKVTFR